MNEKNLWTAVQAELQVLLSETQFNTWLKNTRAENLTENSVDVICETAFAKKQLENLKSLIKASVDKIGKGNFELNIKVGTVKSDPKVEEETLDSTPLFYKQKKEDINKKSSASGLSSKYTFENYIMGANNRLAYAIATAIADNPGKMYNPFFLYSGAGLGKTHLIQAIGNEIIKKHSNLNVIYTTGESFMNELIEIIQSGNRGSYATNKFRNKYRKADVFLIDDVQFIIGKESTQQEFFHTFNALHMEQKQIVIASDRPPKEFTKLEERLTSRFSSGILADISKPDLDTRIAILRTKRDENKDNLPNETIEFIADRVDTNVRELEGAYLQVVTFARATGEVPTIEMAANALGQSLIKQKAVKPININNIIKTVANYYSVKVTDLKGKRRTKDIVIPRQVAMYLIYDLTETPFMSIGELLGGRDHTTVMHGVKKMEIKVKEEEKTKQDIVNIKQVLTL